MQILHSPSIALVVGLGALSLTLIDHVLLFTKSIIHSLILTLHTNSEAIARAFLTSFIRLLCMTEINMQLFRNGSTHLQPSDRITV